MKILFLVHNLGKTRHFENVILGLTKQGHSVTLAAARKRKKLLKLTGVLNADKRIDVVACPVHRVDAWEAYARPLRQARDYLRFLHPDYDHTDKLSARAAQYAPPGWPALVGNPKLRARWRWIARALAAAEHVVPSERYFELFIRSEAPDVILVTPLVDFGSYQTDYVKAAHRLGIPIGFLPFSWDNLTNRGLVRLSPDAAIVWNETQKDELVRFHSVPASRIVITGAPRFDDFFAMRPSSTRAEFTAVVGLPADRPMLLYLCSSKFVAPREVDFINEWIGAIRSAPDRLLRDASILVRPHPANDDQWEGVELRRDGVAVWSNRTTMNADQGLYDSLFHADAVAGLNTSAMIEAGILGKPVFTMTAPEFAGGQEQTLHFHYLLAANGGLVEVASSWTEHMEQLASEIRQPGGRRARSLRFVEEFVRPHGLDQPAAPLMVTAIEGLARTRKRRPLPNPLILPARWTLLAALRARDRTRR